MKDITPANIIINLKYLKNIVKTIKVNKAKKLIPDHQIGFHDQHSTIDLQHRIVNVIENALENNKVCLAVFLDVAQAFDKVWHRGLIHKQ